MSESTEEEPVEQRQPGAAEMSVLSLLQNWKDLTIEQTGPDGTEVLFRIYFYVCPVCRAIVPANYEEQDFQQAHTEFHLRQARDFDALNKVVNILKGIADPEGSDG